MRIAYYLLGWVGAFLDEQLVGADEIRVAHGFLSCSVLIQDVDFLIEVELRFFGLFQNLRWRHAAHFLYLDAFRSGRKHLGRSARGGQGRGLAAHARPTHLVIIDDDAFLFCNLLGMRGIRRSFMVFLRQG